MPDLSNPGFDVGGMHMGLNDWNNALFGFIDDDRSRKRRKRSLEDLDRFFRQSTVSLSSQELGEVVKLTKSIEQKIKTAFNADGKGLHELITSKESLIASYGVDIRNLRVIASMRNKAVHDDEAGIDFSSFQKRAERAIRELNVASVERKDEEDLGTYERYLANKKQNSNDGLFSLIKYVAIMFFIFWLLGLIGKS